jgi:hypothetical protein
MNSGVDYRSNSVSPPDVIRNCIMYALESSSSDALLKCLAGSEWTREYALCRVGEILQEHLKPLAAQISKDGFSPCKSCKEKDRIIDNHIQHVESRVNSNGVLNSSNKTLSKQLDEAIFMKNSMEDQILKLKEELGSNAEHITELKRDRHRLEVEMGQLEKKLVDTSTRYQKVTENTDKVFMERDQMQNESDKIEKLYKNERRKAANLERELEQIQYSHTHLQKNSTAEMSSLRDHINLLKADNLSLQSQVASLTAEQGSKVDDEKKETTKILKKLKDLECQFDGLKVINETLEHKLEFYKSQLLLGNASNSALLAKEVLNEEAKKIWTNEESMGSRNSNRINKNPFESFSSFNNRKVREINVEIRDSFGDDFNGSRMKYDTNKFSDRLRAENDRLKIKLSTLLMQIRHLKELVKVEVSSNRQELITIRTIMVKSLETLSHKVRIGFRRNKIFNERSYKSTFSPVFENTVKHVKYSDDRKENIEPMDTRRYHDRKTPLRNIDNRGSYPLNSDPYRRDQSNMSPLRAQISKNRVLELSEPRSANKLHMYGRQDYNDDTYPRDHRILSPARSPSRQAAHYYKYTTDHRAADNRTPNRGHRKAEWENVGDDIMHHLHRNI